MNIFCLLENNINTKVNLLHASHFLEHEKFMSSYHRYNAFDKYVKIKNIRYPKKYELENIEYYHSQPYLKFHSLRNPVTKFIKREYIPLYAQKKIIQKSTYLYGQLLTQCKNIHEDIYTKLFLEEKRLIGLDYNRQNHEKINISIKNQIKITRYILRNLHLTGPSTFNAATNSLLYFLNNKSVKRKYKRLIAKKMSFLYEQSKNNNPDLNQHFSQIYFNKKTNRYVISSIVRVTNDIWVSIDHGKHFARADGA
jgi:hypothetical protein